MGPLKQWLCDKINKTRKDVKIQPSALLFQRFVKAFLAQLFEMMTLAVTRYHTMRWNGRCVRVCGVINAGRRTMMSWSSSLAVLTSRGCMVGVHRSPGNEGFCSVESLLLWSQ